MGNGAWGLGIGDWVLGIGYWVLGTVYLDGEFSPLLPAPCSPASSPLLPAPFPLLLIPIENNQ